MVDRLKQWLGCAAELLFLLICLLSFLLGCLSFLVLLFLFFYSYFRLIVSDFVCLSDLIFSI